ncbi:oligosaccharide flippase family protein [Clostridium sp. BL-8]|uniref:lipopolysaccharide biosynthesis protein n=1 Tax=Clostridium sp. BL-8 TaxID=349938 RepID=UPI00098CCB53|nr:oligosaccharide flippase family protein [Clostridium sp. BL-8]OOM79438.1 polysaccharide biosynthesis protein [Clostridium sp. BL-8]
MSRTEYAAKNFIWATISTILSTALGFISRTIFIYILGTTYLGVNGLFINILSMLSLTELGIGEAINFSLYKPLADKDEKKLCGLMMFYRNSYRVIALVVATLGISIFPFLNILIKNDNGIAHIHLIYLIFLFNTVTSYLLSYKATLLAADQKSYLLTNINMVTSVITLIVQMVILLGFRNYILYLISASIIGLLKNFYINNYINNRYTYLLEKKCKRLSKKETLNIISKVKAMMFHKVGDVCIYQTDNIITSVFINITTVGLVSNFTMIIDMINRFVMGFFNAASAGLGNLIATEEEKKRLDVFNKYDFFAFWFFGWTSICLYFLLTPFITIWIGSDKLIDNITVALLCINYYLTGMRVPLANVKSAAGVFEQDKWAPIIQSILNLLVSIAGAVKLGLPGIYIGTLISSLVPNIYRPIIVYKLIFKTSSMDYFKLYIKRIFSIMICVCMIKLIINQVFINMNVLFYLISTSVICLLLPNILLIIFFRKTQEFQYAIYVKTKLLNKIIRKLIIN